MDSHASCNLSILFLGALGADGLSLLLFLLRQLLEESAEFRGLCLFAFYLLLPRCQFWHLELVMAACSFSYLRNMYHFHLHFLTILFISVIIFFMCSPSLIWLLWISRFLVALMLSSSRQRIFVWALTSNFLLWKSSFDQLLLMRI